MKIFDELLQLYTAYFNRAADTAGVNYWLDKVETNNWTIDQIAQSFADQKEYQDLYANKSNLQVVKDVYNNLLNRQPDPDGLAYWTNELNNGIMQVENLVLAVMTAATQIDQDNTPVHPEDKKIVDKKVEISKYYYDHNNIDTTISLSTVTQDTTIDQFTASIVDLSTFSNTNTTLADLPTYSTTGVSSLDSKEHWDNSIVTYSFNTSIPSSYYSYDQENLTDGFTPLNDVQKNTVRDVVSDINSILDISLQEVDNDGDIRLSIINMSDEHTAGFTFMPGDTPDSQGDMFLSSLFNKSSDYNYDLDIGGGGRETITHEFGHALGLKHPFNDGNPLPQGSTVLPSDKDNIQHTIMSYTTPYTYHPDFTLTNDGINVEYIQKYPSFYSLYDISTLQSIYGANTTTNTNDDTYSYNYFDYGFNTIWDAGGTDTIDLSSTKGSTTLDLHDGTINSVDQYTLDDIIQHYQDEVDDSYYNNWISQQITDVYNQNELYLGKDNLSIAAGVIIENLKTGSADDIVTDNEVDNIISTGSGDDKIYLGNGGYDHIDGGDGTDTIYLDIAQDQATITDTLDNGSYNLIADNFVINFAGIENISFQDNYISVSDLIV